MQKPYLSTLQAIGVGLTFFFTAWYTNYHNEPKMQILRTGIALNPGIKFLHISAELYPEYRITARPMTDHDTAEKYQFDLQGQDTICHPITIKETSNCIE